VRFRELGLDVTFAEWPGYTAMMADPLDAKLETGTLDAIAAWLARAEPGPQTVNAPAGARPSWPRDLELDGLRESAQRFGPGGSLFGILSEPAERRGELAVLMLNVGGNHHIGPHRLYVKAARALAAAGHSALRFDLAGIGDSLVARDAPLDSAYFRHAMPDVRAAIDLLAQKGYRRFCLMGICSGAYVAFQTALLDARVSGQILMNPRFLQWQATPADTWQASMRRHYKSAGYYRRALLQSHVYQRLLRGEVDVKGVAHRLTTLLSARLSRAAGALLGRSGGSDPVLSGMRRLGARGCDTLMIMSTQDDALDYVEFHLGTRASRMRDDPNFRMVTMEHSDHTFSTHASQRTVIDIVRDHLEQQRKAAVEWNELAGSVAAT
jgi:pimeloyl-ACP methyl ester carboxylesterase